MEEISTRKRPLPLDWDYIMDQNDAEPLQLHVVKGATVPQNPSPITTDHSPRDDLASMSDSELKAAIERQRVNIRKLSSTLPDKGEKLRGWLRALEEEDQRRELGRADTDVYAFEKPIHLMRSGRTEGHKQENALSEVKSQSEFASLFRIKMDGDIDCKVDKPFGKELSILGQCDRHKKLSSVAFLERRRKKGQPSSSRQLPFQSASTLSQDGDKCNGNRADKASSTSFHHNGDRLSCTMSKNDRKDGCQVLSSNASRPRKGQTVVLVDEDETQLVETEQQDKIAERMKDAKIYYPSRDDPESVEICYKDINCLAPEGFLTSEIMNFYIRYLWLQKSPTNEAICDYHIFNTFFYKKLKQAVSYKGSDKESFFVKFRRWWKGVNLFQKAYIFIPIHEDLHWSLVIICIPDKEDESGPIVLHLDSLGLHFSKSVFEEIKSFLRDEWTYMNQVASPMDLPIADKIWKHLPRRIGEKKIEVPQQRNDSDCGLFVLYFMERFIEEAPERLKKKDLAMFGKRWFRPEDASALREKIRKLLLDKFKNANEVDISESLPPSDCASP